MTASLESRCDYAIDASLFAGDSFVDRRRCPHGKDAFLACEESGASNIHRKLLFREESKSTVLSLAFTGRMARGIDNRFASEMRAHEPLFTKYPAHSWIIAPLRAAALAQGRHDLISLWAGQAAPLCRHHKAGELFAALVKETDLLFEGRSPQTQNDDF